MNNIIRIGVLGCADIAKRIVIPNLIKSKNFKLIAVASRTSEKANSIASEFKCDGILGYEN